jgi:type I restriction enzyme R subunit
VKQRIVSQNAINSLNFGFVHAHDPLLELYAARAERYVFDDPNTSVIKQRQFAEFLARHVAAFHGIETVAEDFRQTLAIIRDKRLATREIVGLFDHLRLAGNEAVHEGANDRHTALAGLITAQRLAEWFQQTFVDPEFKAGPFKPPPNPTDVADSLREELDTLREKAARHQQELMQARGDIGQLERLRTDLERQAEEIQQQLIAKESLLAATEQSQKKEKENYEQQLRQLADEALSKAPNDLKSFIERSQRAAKALGLDREESQYIPLAQIRVTGPNVSDCHKAPMLLVQSMKGGFVTANCSICGEKSVLRNRDFFDLDLWVSCPKCRQRMKATMVAKNYGFECECPTCNWRCILASMLPQWDELI